MLIVQAITVILMLVLNTKNESYVNFQVFLGVLLLATLLYRIEKALGGLYEKF